MLLHRISLIGIVLITFGSSLAAFEPDLLLSPVAAQTKPRPNRSQKKGWLQELNLTSQQIAQIEQIRNQSKQKNASTRQALRQAQQELVILLGGNASKEQLRSKYNQIRGLRQQLTDAEFENTLAIRDVLTPEQRQKFIELMFKRRRPDSPTSGN
jgi:Spy/CpxP family protein refolding chaperone